MSKLSVHVEGSAVGAYEVAEDERLLKVKDSEVDVLLDTSVFLCDSSLVDFVLVVEVLIVSSSWSSSSLYSSSMTFPAS